MTENQTTEEKIIQPAEQIFLAKGLDAARMSDIAEKAGISRTSLNYYYRTKENLFYAIIERLFDALLPRIESLSAISGELSIRIQAFVDIYFELIRDNKLLFRVVLLEINRKPKLIYNYFNTSKKAKNYFQVLNSFIDSDPANTTESQKAHLMCTFFGLLFTPFLIEPLLEMYFDTEPEYNDAFMKEQKEIIKKLMKSYFT